MRFAVLANALAAFAVIAVGGPAAASAGERASFSGSFTVALQARADSALSLFDPIGESRWAPDWAPSFVRAEDRATLSEGTVFTTPGHGAGDETWVLQRYDRVAHEIAYTVYEPLGAVFTIRISLRDDARGTSRASVRYDAIATSESGDRVVRHLASVFPGFGRHWQTALDAALAH